MRSFVSYSTLSGQRPLRAADRLVVYRDKDVRPGFAGTCGIEEIRRTWTLIRRVLETYKSKVEDADVSFTRQGTTYRIEVQSGESESVVPVVLRRTFHPGFRSGTAPTLPCSPFFTVAFVEGVAEFEFARGAPDIVAVGVSGVSLAGMLAVVVLSALRRRGSTGELRLVRSGVLQSASRDRKGR